MSKDQLARELLEIRELLKEIAIAIGDLEGRISLLVKHE